MTTDLWLDRETAEQVWLEEWEEIQADPEALKLFRAAQDKDKATQAEVDRLLAAGDCEILF